VATGDLLAALLGVEAHHVGALERAWARAREADRRAPPVGGRHEEAVARNRLPGDRLRRERLCHGVVAARPNLIGRRGARLRRRRRRFAEQPRERDERIVGPTDVEARRDGGEVRAELCRVAQRAALEERVLRREIEAWKQSGADAVSPALGGDAGVARMAVRLRKLLGALEIVRK